MSGSSMLDLAFSSERKNRNHLLRIRPLSRSSLSPSTRMHCDSTLFVSSSCPDLIFSKNPCWSPMRNCLSNPTTWRSKNEQLLHFALSLASYMLFWQPSAAAYPCCPFSGAATLRASHQSQSAAQLPFGRVHSKPRLGLLSWGGITNSAVHMMATANVASTSSTLLSPGRFALRCLPTDVVTSCRSWG